MCKLVQFLVLGVMGICFSAHALHSATLSVFPNPAYAGDLVSLVIKESIFQSGPRVKHIVKVGSIEAEIVNVSGTIITFRVPIETNAGEVLVSHEYESGDSDPLTTIMNIRNGGMSQYALVCSFHKEYWNIHREDYILWDHEAVLKDFFRLQSAYHIDLKDQD